MNRFAALFAIVSVVALVGCAGEGEGMPKIPAAKSTLRGPIGATKAKPAVKYARAPKVKKPTR